MIKTSFTSGSCPQQELSISGQDYADSFSFTN
jgi:hypothetical protein